MQRQPLITVEDKSPQRGKIHKRRRSRGWGGVGGRNPVKALPALPRLRGEMVMF